MCCLAVNIVKDNFPANGWHTNTVAIPGNTGDHALNQMTVLGLVQFAKSKGIKKSNGPSTHGKNIAQDATNSRRRTLKWLDKRRVIVGFHFKHGGKPISNIHSSGILPGPLNHPFPFSGKTFQMNPGTLIGAMLTPHNRKHTKFGEIRLAPKVREDLLIQEG